MRLFNRKTEETPEPKCPSCGERVPENAAQCAMCGTPMSGEAAPTTSEPDAETQSVA